MASTLSRFIALHPSRYKFVTLKIIIFQVKPEHIRLIFISKGKTKINKGVRERVIEDKTALNLKIMEG